MQETQTHVDTFLLEIDLPFDVFVKCGFRSISFIGLRISCGVFVEDEYEFVGNFLLNLDSFVVTDKLKYGMFLR